MTKLEAVLFDMDGVLVDSEPLWSEGERLLLARRDLCYSPELKAMMMGRDARDAVDCLKQHYSLEESVDDLIEERNRLMMELFREHLHPIPDALVLLRALHAAQIKTALVSSSAYRLVKLVVEKFNIADFFDLIVSGDQVAKGKPAPDIYSTAASILGVSPHCCLVIEDAPTGVIAAKAAGMSCVAVSASASEQELVAADRVVTSLAEVDLVYLQKLVEGRL